MHFWKQWRFKNLTFFLLSIIIALILSKIEVLSEITLRLDSLSYLGAFIAGMLFTSMFTFITGAFILISLAQKLPLFQLCLVAGLGAVTGDYAVFRFVRYRLAYELVVVYEKLGGKNLNNILRSKYCKWILPIVGAFIIASPLPDEIGVAILGLEKVKTYKFVILSFVLNVLGIFLFLLTALVLKR